MLSQGGMEPSNVVCGAVQAVLAHPTNSDICFAGATNGGVWRTFTCTATEPDWQPLTDQEESLAIGDMVFDDDDANRNTILAGIGTRSSFTSYNLQTGPATGLLYTQNALAAIPTWTVLDNTAGSVDFRANKVQFRSVFARGNLMLAAAYVANPNNCANRGVFRSADRGVTWRNVLPGIALAIASDPNDEMRFYATLDRTGGTDGCDGPVDNGVFTSNDGGATWAPTAFTTNIPPGRLNNAKLSVSRDQSRVWSALLRQGRADSISYSDDQGDSWTTLDDVLVSGNSKNTGLNPREKPGGQGSVHFALLASPTNSNEVYVGGDRQPDNREQNGMGSQFPNNLGAVRYSGILFRGNASVTATGMVNSPQWEHMTDSNSIAAFPGGGTASSSAPHADCRDMEIRADGRILEGDDGGITLRTNPTDNTGDWFGLCGNMQVFETHSMAYEPFFGTVLFGNQDTGTIAGRLGDSDTFDKVAGGDGNSCMIDYTSDPDFQYYYFGFQYYLSMYRYKVSKITGKFVSANFGIHLNWGSFLGDFVSVTAMNPSDQQVFAVATSTATTLQSLPANVLRFTLDRGNNFQVANYGSTAGISAMEWSRDGTFLYVANGEKEISRCELSGSALNCAIVGAVTNVARSIAVDATNRNTLFAVTTSSYVRGAGVSFDLREVFKSTDGGVTWSDITSPESLVDTAENGGSAAYINGFGASVVVGTSNGVLVPDGAIGWKRLAVGLPKVPVLRLVYEAVDDRLVVATLGRGVWFLEKAGEAVALAAGNMPPVGGAEWIYSEVTPDFESWVKPDVFFPSDRVPSYIKQKLDPGRV